MVSRETAAPTTPTHSSDDVAHPAPAQVATAQGRTYGAPDLAQGGDAAAPSRTRLSAALAANFGLGEAGRAATISAAHATIGTARLNRLMNPPLGPAADSLSARAFTSGKQESHARSVPAFSARDSDSEAPSAVREALSAPGASLDAGTRGVMEARFGRDLSRVRVHTDDRAAAAARAVGAAAFAVGRSIVFDRGRYAPGDPEGRAVLAHEIAHTIQQGHADPPSYGRPLRVGPPDSAAEAEARQIAAAPFGAGAPGPRRRLPPTLQRSPDVPAHPATQWRGETVHHLADTTFFAASNVAEIDKKLGNVTLLDVPIPDLGVRVGVAVNGKFGLVFGGAFTSRLENARAVLDWDQERRLELEEGAGADTSLLHWDPMRVAELSSGLGAFDGGADLIVLVHVYLQGRAEVGVSVGATVARAFDVASLGTGLEAHLNGEFVAEPRFHLDLHYRDGRLNFAFGAPVAADLSLAATLDSFVRAKLLGFTWEKSWRLAERKLKEHWSAAAFVGFDSDIALPGLLNFADRANDLVSLLRMLFDAGDQPHSLHQDPVAPTASTTAVTTGQAGGGGPGGGAPTGGGTGGGGPTGGGPATNLPTGRYESDPIPMIWYKPPGLYPNPIQLDSGGYWLSEPVWLKVPDVPDLSDVRRHALTDPSGDKAIEIGVPVKSKFFPRIGRVWPRVHAGPSRTGVKQDQFRRVLRAHGYAWGTKQADHVRDLQWAGEDDYANLWPLEEARNLAANYILRQPVSYQTRAGVARANVPLRTTELDLYFRIVGLQPPP